jgi:benzoyl-CoA 2,3-dioxygenase component B
LTPEGKQEVPTLNALNEVMRESYLKDCEIGLRRWNRAIERAGFPALALKLPSTRFRRSIGAWAGQTVTPEGSWLKKISMRGI